MAWTIYQSTNVSAPALSGSAGSLVALLDAVLVNGYGTQPAAGWTKEFSGTDKAVYRNGAASLARKYFRVQDDGPSAGTSFQSSANTIRTKMDSGRYRQRRRSLTVVRTASARWAMDDLQLYAFENFFQTDLSGGSDWFTIGLPLGFGIQAYSARFVGGYSANYRPHMNWTVSGQLEIFEQLPFTGDDGEYPVVGDAIYVLIPGSIGFTDPGSVVTVGKVRGYATAPRAGTLGAWSFAVDAGTATVDVWKKATGIAVPTVADKITTGGLSIASGTYFRSTDMSDLTTTVVVKGDIFVFDIIAVSGVTQMTFQLEIS